MIENDIKRNASGYYDETPVKSGVFNGPQAGEIWETTMGKEYLILKNHGGYCNTLLLRDHTTHTDNIEVVSREVRYVNPVMIGYLANREISQFVKAVPEEKYMEVMEAIGERLGVTIKVSKAEDDNMIHPLEVQCKGLQHQLEEANTEIECLVKERIAIREELRECQKNAIHADVAAAVKAEMYENLYKDLLKECLARGEAK